eukprot:3882102-Pleurochrysis_carterae.AAC.1
MAAAPPAHTDAPTAAADGQRQGDGSPSRCDRLYSNSRRANSTVLLGQRPTHDGQRDVSSDPCIGNSFMSLLGRRGSTGTGFHWWHMPDSGPTSPNVMALGYSHS